MATKKSARKKTAKKKGVRVKTVRKTAARKSAARKSSTRKSASKRRKPRFNPSKPHVYCGELLYPGLDEIIEVNRFIVKREQISFDLVTTWNLGVRWGYSGIASPQEDGGYRSVDLIGHEMIGQRQVNDLESVPCSIIFRIGRQSDRQVTIKGTWSEGGDTYLFEGKLKRFVPPKPARVF